MTKFLGRVRFIKYVLFLSVLLPEVACQTASRPPLVMAIGDPWFGNARTGDWATFQKLQIKLERPWDFRSSHQVTALMVAARNGHLEFVQNLLKNNVDVNLVDKYRYSVLSYALHGPTTLETRHSMCTLLVKNGADPFVEDKLKLSAILLMIEYGFEDCIRATQLTKKTPCDQASRLSEVKSIVNYAQHDRAESIRAYLISQGCK